MAHDLVDRHRRALLRSAAAIIAGHAACTGASAQTANAPSPAASTGQAGDFHFLAGQWTIHHRQRKADATWIEFDGEATCWDILGGTGSIEELRIPARDFSGLGIRLLDPKTRAWNDYWVNGKERAIGEPGLTGGFVDGVGTFTAADTEEGKPVIYRGVWDQITPRAHRWRQGVSRDAGRTWDDTWFMTWARV